MRRPQSASGLAAVTASLLVVTMTAAPAGAARVPAEPAAAPVANAAAGCTPWRSEFTPPRTIRVLRSKASGASGAVAGTVQEVDFREYVAVTMATEWPEHYPLETLKAGAIATKQFAWYYVINPRGGTKWVDGRQECYDVVDTWVDQVYNPEQRGIGMDRGPGPKIAKAIDVTWDVSLRKYKRTTGSSRFFLTGYRAGTATTCGADANGFKLFHRSTKACGKDGSTYREILRLYLKPNLEIVRPGRHDVIGSKHGDAAAMVLNDDGQLVAHVWSPGRASPAPGSKAGVRLASADLVGYRSSDIDGDGRDDLVWLKQTGASSGSIRVALSRGADYGDAEVWYEGDTLAPLAGAELLVGDFNANGRRDVGILARGEGGGSRLVVFRKKAGNALNGPRAWWSGGHDLDRVASAWAADLSGDGRADLVIRQNLGGGGLRIKTAVAKSPLPSGDQRLGALKTRFESTALESSQVKMTIADANRDGRDDVVMLIGGSDRAKIDRLQGQLLGGFKRVRVWRAPASDPIPVRWTRLGAADIDYDGRTDLVLFTKKVSATRIRPLKTRYESMKPAKAWTEAFDWSDVRPY